MATPGKLGYGGLHHGETKDQKPGGQFGNADVVILGGWVIRSEGRAETCGGRDPN